MASITLLGRLSWEWGRVARTVDETEMSATAETVHSEAGQAWPPAHRRDDYILVPTMAGPMMVVAARRDCRVDW